jgi:hypothetical protein
MGDIECGNAPAYGDEEYSAIASGRNVEECVALLEKDTSITDSTVIPKSRNSTPTSETSFTKLLLSFVMGVAACFAIQYAFPWLCFASSPNPATGSFNNIGDAGSQVVSSERFGIAQPLSFVSRIHLDFAESLTSIRLLHQPTKIPRFSPQRLDTLALHRQVQKQVLSQLPPHIQYIVGPLI